jgi:hypothetical protein
MRISLATRAGRAFFAATLVLSLSLSPSFARIGGSAGASLGRPAFGMAHFSHFGPHRFGRRFDAGRFSFNRFGPSRFDRFGFNHFSRFGNQLFVGGWGWGGYSAPAAASGPMTVGDGAPIIINIGVDPTQGDAAGAYAGGCVIHKLIYDSNGKYVGERQIPQC